MSDKKNDSSSEDDESTKKALEEATDQNFLSNSMFKVNKTKRTHEDKRAVNCSENSEKKLKPSLRINPDRADNFHSFGVTQSYKDYVAKKLSEILDRDIEIDEVKYEETENTVKDEQQEIGIQLLKTSKNLLTGYEEEEVSKIIRKKPLKNSETRAENLLKCREAAVNPEKILSKLEVKSWNEKQKGTVFNYKKMADGSLIER